MAGRQLAGFQLREDGRRKLEESYAVCHSRTTFAYACRDVLLREVEFVTEALEGTRLFDRIQVLALEVFDQRQLERFDIVRLAYGYWHPIQPGALSGAESALAGDQLVAINDRTDEEWLEEAFFTN